MALRDNPYLPLYIQDFLTDEKLIECSAQSTGVYIRLMCIMHKSDDYGKILLKQKDKQTDKQIKNFALKIAKHMPYSVEIVESSIDELVAEKVLYIEDDFLVQKRMVRDCEISLKRASAGSEGGKKTMSFASGFAQAKFKANNQANSDNDNDIENENDNKEEKEIRKIVPPKIEWVTEYCNERKNNIIPQQFFDFYETKAWFVGKNKIKDWQACVRTWEKNNQNNQTVKKDKPKTSSNWTY